MSTQYLESEKLYLRTVRKADLCILEALMADREIALLSGEIYPMTEKGLEEFYEKCQTMEERVWFVIVDKNTNEVIGETGLLRIFFPWRTSDYSLIIWNRNYWHKGYGKQTAQLMLDYGFNTLNLHRIAIGVVGSNQQALAFWKNIGFKEEGIQKDGYYRSGKYSDFIMLYMLEEDYRKAPQ